METAMRKIYDQAWLPVIYQNNLHISKIMFFRIQDILNNAYVVCQHYINKSIRKPTYDVVHIIVHKLCIHIYFTVHYEDIEVHTGHKSFPF